MDNFTEQEQTNAEVIRKLVIGFQTGNLEQVETLVHKDFINHNAPEGLQDRNGFKEIIKMVNGSFSRFDELTLQPDILFAKDDFVAMMDTGTGTRNGKTYRHDDIHIFIMKDGQMYQHWNSFGLPCQRDVLINFIESSN